jgi:hypothetical protein
MQYAPMCPAENALERLAHRWFTYWHGEGAPHQYRYYRCKGCAALITWNTIRKGGCECDLEKKLVPAKLSLVEKFKILVLPWMV